MFVVDLKGMMMIGGIDDIDDNKVVKNKDKSNKSKARCLL